MTGPKHRYQPWDAPEILVRAGRACWQWPERGFCLTEHPLGLPWGLEPQGFQGSIH